MRFLPLSIFILLSIFWFSTATAEKKSAPDTVMVGTYVISLHDINFRDKEYTLRYWMWMLYTNPNFDFTDQVEVPNAKSMEKPDMFVDTLEGKTWVLVKMKNVMKQNWNVHDYPFDKQELVVHVENTTFDARTLVFKADTSGSKFDPDITVDGWSITDFWVDTGINDYLTAFGDPRYKQQYSEYATFNIHLKIKRNAWGLFLKIFIGMYIAFAISLITFIIDPANVDPRFGLPVGGLFAAVGNKYIIDSILPETSEFTLVDSLHTLTFMFILFTIAISAYSLILLTRGKQKEAKRINRKGAIAVTGFYVFMNLLLIGMALFSN